MTAPLRSLLSILLLAGLLGGCGKLDAPITGTYRAEVELRGGAVPFEMQVQEGQGRTTLVMAQGEQWLPLTGVAMQDGTLKAQLPGAVGTLTATFGRSGFNGEVRLTDTQGKSHTLPFSAELDKNYRFVEKPSTDNADVSGYWQLEVEPQHFAQSGTVHLLQRFDAVDGQLLLPDGRQIPVIGQVDGDNVYLSTFTQGGAMLFKGRVNSQGELQGEAWINSSAASDWVARRMLDDEVAALAVDEVDEPVRKVALPWNIPTR